MGKIKVGIIGVGPRGRGLYRLIAKNNQVQPCAISDISEETMKTFAEELAGLGHEVQTFADYHDLLASDVEAVIVSTGVDTHAAIASDCLYAGKHVLCEIPNIASLAQAKQLLKACRDNPQCKFMVAEECCYWAFVQSWKKMYEDGLLGDIVFAESDYLHETDSFMKPNTYTWRSYMPSVTYLTHNLGPLLYILGDTCDEISGFIPDINPIKDHYVASPNGVCMVKTKKGTLIKIFVGFGMRHSFAHNFVMYGSRGSLENQRQGPFNSRHTIATLDAIPYKHEREMEIPICTDFPGTGGADASGHGGADPKMLEAFVDCIVQDTEPPLGIEFGINIALPGILADISSREHGKTYKMPSLAEILES